jgi:N-acylneuraminate cytidylyltransferase
VITDGRTIAGHVLLPFFTQGYEGFDVNQTLDWQLAEELVGSGLVSLPRIGHAPFLVPGTT